jgi:2-polyprenyl-3-methyl-5-hydroxy-6-metoxy-1,4-benzoquinol methylase
MVEVNCYNCGSDKSTFYATENSYDLVKCSDCGLLYVNPRPADGEIIEGAQQGLHKGDVTFNVTGRFDPLKVLMYNRVLRDLYPDGCSAGTWLDIGCGHGELLACVNKLYSGSISIKGTEPNVHKQKSAQKKGLDVTYFDIYTHSARYDIISLLNVYSHLPDPKEFILRCKEMLTPGGELIIQTGDSADFPPEEHFRPLFLPDHLSFANEKILRSILSKCGFGVIQLRHYSIVHPNARSIAKELLKIVWPGQKSRIKYMLSSKYKIDMFIRASTNFHAGY